MKGDRIHARILGQRNGRLVLSPLALLAWSEEAQELEAEAPFWVEHSLNEQRFFNPLCWVYGQDPGRFQNLVQEGHLPGARADRCPREWEQIDKSWTALPEPHLAEE